MRFIYLIPALFWLSSAHALDFQAEQVKIDADAKAAVNRLSALPEQELSAEHWYLLSYGYMKLLNKEGALAAINKALELGLSDSRQIAALHHKALVYGMMFRDTKAGLEQLKLAETVLDRYSGEDKPVLQTSLYESFAQGYNQRGDIKNAVKYAELSLAIATEFQLEKAELQGRIIAGRLSLQQNNYHMAQRQFSRALELAQTLDEKASIGSIHLRLGMAYNKLELYPLAADHLVQAEQFLQMPDRRNQLITVLLTQFEHYLAVKDTERAAVASEKAAKLLAELKDPYLTAQLQGAEAQLALLRNNPQLAEQQLLKAAQLFQQLSNRSMQYETAVTLAEVALQQEQIDKARTYLPQDMNIDNQPVYLQRKYWDLMSRIYAKTGEWQLAYQAALSASAAQFKLQSNLQHQHLDQLSAGLQQQQQLHQAESRQRDQQTGLWVLVASLISSWLIFAVLLIRRRKAATPGMHGQISLHSWTGFVRQLRKEHQKAQSLSLFAVQIKQISEYKLKTGEQLLRKQLGLVTEQLKCPQLVDFTIHTDVLWLAVAQVDHTWILKLQQALLQVQQALPEQPDIRVWQGELSQLLPNDWQDADINGLRELVWHDWQQQPAEPASLLHYHCETSQQAPCSWQAFNLRQDISNAQSLGLLKLQIQPLTPA